MASIRVESSKNSVVHNASLFSLSWTTSCSIPRDYYLLQHSRGLHDMMSYAMGSERVCFETGLTVPSDSWLVLINFWSLHVQKPLNWCQFFHYSHMHFNKPWSWFYSTAAFWNTLQERFVVSSEFGLEQVCRLGEELQKSESHEKPLLISMLCCHIIYYLHAEVAFWIPLKFFRGFLSHFCCKTLASCLLTQGLSGADDFCFPLWLIQSWPNYLCCCDKPLCPKTISRRKLSFSFSFFSLSFFFFLHYQVKVHGQGKSEQKLNQ